jgi:hypothetical protein
MESFMAHQFRTTGFKALQAHWYQKLRESGFVDIESEDARHDTRPGFDRGGYGVSKTRGSNASRSEVCAQAAYRYFELALHLLESFAFESELQRSIWRMHCQGFSLRQISQTVRKDKDHVHGVVKTLKSRMMNGG